MLSNDFLSSLDTTIRDQETTIRCLEAILAELKENHANSVGVPVRKEKKRKPQRINRSTQCEPGPIAAKTCSSRTQTDSPRLEFSKSETVEIQTTKPVDYSLRIDNGFAPERQRLPVFQAFHEHVTRSSTVPNFPESIWKNTSDSGNGTIESNSLDLLDRSNGIGFTFADSMKKSEITEQILKSDFPALTPNRINSEANGNGDSALLSAMRLNRGPPKAASVTSSTSRSTSPAPSQNSTGPRTDAHKKETLIITNFGEHSPSEITKFVTNFCKSVGVEKSKVRNAELFTVNDFSTVRALKITFDSVATATMIMAKYYDTTPHAHFPFPSISSRIYFHLTQEERYRVKELQNEANFKNSQLEDGEMQYYVCALDLVMKRKRGLKRAEILGNSANNKSRTIDCAMPLGVSPNVLFHSFKELMVTSLGGRREIDFNTLISMSKRVDQKKLSGAFVAQAEVLVRIGLCASNPKQSFSYLVTRRKGVVFFYDDSDDATHVKGNSKNKFALLDEDEDDNGSDDSDDSMLMLLNETASGDGEESKRIAVASVVRRNEKTLQLVKPDYKNFNNDAWWLEARLSGRLSSIYVEDTGLSESMNGGSSLGAQCLIFLDRVLTEIHDALGASAELHFRLEKKETDRMVRFAVTDTNSSFQSLLKKF